MADLLPEEELAKEQHSVIPRCVTDEDLKRFAEVLAEVHERKYEHVCRFSKISPEQLAATVEFATNANKFFTDSRNAALKTVVSIVTGFIIIALGSGIVVSIKSFLKSQ